MSRFGFGAFLAPHHPIGEHPMLQFRRKLATGVVSLPYHHPFNVAQRMVQLDYMTGGRVIFGSGPGALASDAHTLGIDAARPKNGAAPRGAAPRLR